MMLGSHTLARTIGAAVVLAAAAASPAQAAEDLGSATISHVQAVDGGVDVLVSVPVGSEVDLASVSMTIDGLEAQATAQQASGADAVRRTTVLAIDTSNSMRGARFEAAKQAAQTFLDTVPDDVYVGIVAFAGEVTTAQAPTLDHSAARAVLDALTLSRETRLYDGVLSAIEVAGTDGQRNLLVLSDGADTTSTRLSSVLNAVRDSETLVDVISLDAATDATNSDLEALARAGEGTVIPASSDALRAAFADEADALQRQILVTASLPEGLTATEATVAISLDTSTGALRADAFATVATTSGEPAPLTVPTLDAGGTALPSWALYAGIGALGIGLIGVFMLLVPRPPPPMSAADRVTAYTASTTGLAGERPHLRIDTDQAITQAKDAAATMLRRNRDLETRIARRLDAAGSELKPAEWLLLHIGIFLGVGLVGVLLAAGTLVLGILVILLGAIVPWVVLVVRGSRRRRKFDAVLPDTLQLMSGALAAGLSLQQAVDTIVKEGSDPIASEFRRVLVETRLGVPVEIALDGVAERFGSKDFEWVVMAIRIQRQVGGNLAELLDTVAATMREREYMRRQVASLSAEGRLSAWVLGLLPPLFLLYLLVTQGSYVEPLFSDPRGWFMLAFAGLWLGIGVFWMSRLVKVEV